MKKRLRPLLEQQNFAEIADLAGRSRRVLSALVSLTFDPDPLIAWRAVEAMGTAAERIADDDPDCVRDHLRRLHWLLSEESGGICWRAPEAMAQIIHRRPALFGEYVPVVVSLIEEMADEDLDHFRCGILWAIARLGSGCHDVLEPFLPTIVACLEHAEPQVRGMAVWCLCRVGHGGLLATRPALLDDEGPVDLYRDRLLHRTSVSDLARRACRDAPDPGA